MKRYFAVGAAGAISLGMFVSSCGNTCGTGTHMGSNDTCVADGIDASTPGSDAGGTGDTCGTNTTADSTNACQITTAACGPGTVLDAPSHTCKIPVNNGTLVNQSAMYRGWQHFSYNNTTPPDGGSMYPVVGDRAGNVTSGAPDASKMFMLGKLPGAATPDPVGLHLLPVHWFAQAGIMPTNMTTAIDHQITIAEWKTCTANYAIYKNPPDGKHFYKITVDVSGCPPDLTFSVWNFYTTTSNLMDRVLGTPSGGLPNAFNVNGDGTGHFEREEDPAVWFASGATLNGASHIAGMGGKIPNLTTFPNATMYIDLDLHNSTQSNGNAGFCETDPLTNSTTLCGGSLVPNGPCCVTPPSPNLFLPGQFTIDSSLAFIGGRVPEDVTPGPPAGQALVTPTPLSMLQPY